MRDDGFFEWLAVFAFGVWCSAIVFYGSAW